jgi:hypothetical protein
LCLAGDTQPAAGLWSILPDEWAAYEPAAALSRKDQDFFSAARDIWARLSYGRAASMNGYQPMFENGGTPKSGETST